MARLKLDEKKLKALREQLYGKEKEVKKKFSNSPVVTEDSTINKQVPKSEHVYIPSNPMMAATFMKADLIKILILSILAIGTQLILHFLMQRGFISLDSLIRF